MILGQARQLTYLYICFFLSGLTALIYEIGWLQKMQLVLGVTAYTQAVTLSAFLGGLGLGALASSKILEKGYRPLNIYLLAELAIGVYAIAFLPLLHGLEFLLKNVIGNLASDPIRYAAFQFCFAFVLLIVPTFLMGLTLPLMVRFARLILKSNKITELYVVNTADAFAGCLLAGFFLLPTLGFEKTMWLAAILNFLLFFGAILIFRLSPGNFLKIEDSVPQRNFQRSILFSGPIFVLFLSGLVSLIAQIVWSRMISMIIGPSVYVFPLSTSVVLLGIVTGGLISKRISFLKNDFSFRILILAGLLFTLTNYLLCQMPLLLPSIYNSTGPNFSALILLEFLVLCLIMLPCASVLGALFPIAINFVAKDEESEHFFISAGYFANIAGLFLGALLTANYILPKLGIEALSMWLSVVLVFTGFWFVLKNRLLAPGQVATFLVFSIACIFSLKFDKQILSSGLFYNRIGAENIGALRGEINKLVDYRDGPQGTVTISQIPSESALNFSIDGKIDGSNLPTDMDTFTLTAILPLLARSNYRSILTIGIGTGTTAAFPLRWFPNLEVADLLEMSPVVVEMSKKYFYDINHALWTDPRSRIHVREAREFLQHTENKYDLIVTEPSNPWVNGVSSLYTIEHFENLKKRLNPEGWVLLWFHSYSINCDSVLTVFKTVANSFSSMFVLEHNRDLFILASPSANQDLHPLPDSMGEVEKMMFGILKHDPSFSRADSYSALMSVSILLDRQKAIELAGNAPLNTDDNQSLQYQTGRVFWQNKACDIKSHHDSNFAKVSY